MRKALEIAKKFTLEGVAQKVECPFLVVHGQDDRIVPVDAAHKLYAALGSKKKDLRIFTAEEGGAEHCQVDHRQLRRRLHRRLADEEHVDLQSGSKEECVMLQLGRYA